MIDFKQVFSVMRSIVINRIGDEVSAVIQSRTTGTKPKSVYATVDIQGIFDSAGHVTNKYLDSDTDEIVYETVKDVDVVLSVRNGKIDDPESQMAPYTLCNNLHKAFAEVLVRDYLYDNLNAVVRSTGAVRGSSDRYSTGYGTVQEFIVTIRMVDTTREANTPIGSVVFPDLNSNGSSITTYPRDQVDFQSSEELYDLVVADSPTVQYSPPTILTPLSYNYDSGINSSDVMTTGVTQLTNITDVVYFELEVSSTPESGLESYAQVGMRIEDLLLPQPNADSGGLTIQCQNVKYKMTPLQGKLGVLLVHQKL